LFLAGACFLHSTGLSLGASLLCLGYLLKNWRRTSSHLITTTFTLLISTHNIVVFGMRAATIVGIATLSICPPEAYDNVTQVPTFRFVSLAGVFKVDGHLDFTNEFGYEILSICVIPVFLWISDAFLASASLLR
jgi:hypothetical protein